MRKSKYRLNTIVAVTYSAIIGLALIVINIAVSASLGQYLINQRVTEQSQKLNGYAVSLSAYLTEADPDAIYNIAQECSQDMQGRVLLLNMQGVVQIDTFFTLNGTQLDTGEVLALTQGEKDTAYSFHSLKLTDSSAPLDNTYLPYKKNRSSYWAAYYTSTIIVGDTRSGILLVSVPVQDVVDRIDSIRVTVYVISGIIGIIAIFVIVYMANRITLSVRKFNGAIANMSAGDFSVKVDEDGLGELSDLAGAFNIMSRRLENLDKSRNEFVSDASHELKTPLASMKILTEALLTQSEAPIELYREFLGDINHEVDRLTLVINDLLALVRMDRNENDIVRMPIQLGGLIERVIDNLKPLAERKEIEISFVYDDVIVPVDENKIQQMLTNLIDNAIKYSPANTTVSVSLGTADRYAKIVVSDQGFGIPQEAISRVFERFYRVDKARSRSTGGTGLGLAITKNIVELHGGHIELESEEDKGSVFTVYLPLNAE